MVIATSHTFELLPEEIKGIQGKGYQVVEVLLEEGRPPIDRRQYF
jgi:hypothetical protein